MDKKVNTQGNKEKCLETENYGNNSVQREPFTTPKEGRMG